MNILTPFTKVVGWQGSVKGARNMRELREPWRWLWRHSVRGAINLTRRTYHRYRVWRVPEWWIVPPPRIAGAYCVEQDMYGVMQRIEVVVDDVISTVEISQWPTDKAMARAIFSPARRNVAYLFIGDELMEFLDEARSAVPSQEKP